MTAISWSDWLIGHQKSAYTVKKEERCFYEPHVAVIPRHIKYWITNILHKLSDMSTTLIWFAKTVINILLILDIQK